MNIRSFKLWMGIFLLLCMSPKGWAQVVHWEVDGTFRFPGEDTVLRVVSGGFDFDTKSSVFSNVTLASTSIDPGCFGCFDYEGADGDLVNDATTGVVFTKRIDFESPVYQIGTLRIYEGGNLQEPFDLTQPGIYNALDMFETLYIYLGDPLDPDIFTYDSCFDCATAIGTLVPIPEPETYAMLLAGLALIGLRRRQSHSGITRNFWR